MCPIYQWAAVVKQICIYLGKNDKTPVSAVWCQGQIDHITSKMITDALEASIAAVVYDKLRTKKGKPGKYSIRWGMAIAPQRMPSLHYHDNWEIVKWCSLCVTFESKLSSSVTVSPRGCSDTNFIVTSKRESHGSPISIKGRGTTLTMPR